MESLKPLIEYEEFGDDSEHSQEEEGKDFIKRKGARDLTRGDKAALVAAGIRGVLTKMGQHIDPSVPINLDLDRNSKLQASIIVI